jgi:hypothetical protein
MEMGNQARPEDQLLCALLGTNKLSLRVGTAGRTTISPPKKISIRSRDWDQCA